jgi:hypothetical protein
VAPAYAWYWNLTGDTLSLNRGDELFQHALDDPAHTIWSGKQFSQIYKWTFDYVRWRSGLATSGVVSENNPFTGPYADTEPPIQTKVAVTNLKDTTATITWNTYENADSQIMYGGASGHYPLHSGLQDGGQGTMSHSVTLTGLTPGMTYHYRINSHDGAKNLASRADATFTTSGSQGGGGGTVTGSGAGAGTDQTEAQNGSSSSGTGDTSSGSGSTTGTDLSGNTPSSPTGSQSAGSPQAQSQKNTFSPRQTLMQ